MGKFKKIAEAAGGGAGKKPEPSPAVEPSPAPEPPPTSESELSPEEMHLAQRDAMAKAGEKLELERKAEADEGELKLAELKKMRDESAKVYKDSAGELDAKQGFLSRMFKGKTGSGDEAAQAFRKKWTEDKKQYEQTLLDDLENKHKRGEITPEERDQQRLVLLAEFAKNFTEVEGERDEAAKNFGVKKGWLSEKIEKGWQKFEKVWKNTPWYVKIGVGLGIGAAGGFFAFFGIGVMRLAGGAMFGKAIQEKLQAKAEDWREKQSAKEQEELKKLMEREDLTDEEKHKLALQFVEKKNNEYNDKIVSEGKWDGYRKWAGWATGGIVGSGVLAYLAKGAIGHWWDTGGGKGGAVVPEKIPTMPHGHVINEGDNIWKVTRDIYTENPKGYGIDVNDPSAEKLFHSFKRQGILGRLGIDADNFSDLSDDEKIKMLAEKRTAESVRKLTEFQGGRVRDLVHAGDAVVVKPDGTIVFDNTSGIKAGYLDDVRTRGGGGAAENYGRGGARGMIDTSQYDQQIEAARARGAVAETWRQNEMARLGAEAHGLNEQAIAGVTDANARLWNRWLEGLGGFQLDTPAQDIQEAIGRHSPGVIGDTPMIPTADELAQTGNAVAFTQDTFQKFPPLDGRETMQAYLERMSRTNFNLFKALSIIHKL